MYFYIYKMSDLQTGEFYIGRRKSKVSPEMDTYRGSSKTWYKLLSKNDIKSLDKEILEVFNSFEEMCLSEIDYITKNIKNPLCKNSHLPGKGFYCKGHTDETKRKMKGKVMVRDSEGNILKIDKDDERYTDGTFQGINKNKVVVKDKEGKTLSVYKNDERYIKGDLVPANKGMVTVRNKEGKIIQISKNEFDCSKEEYSHVATGHTPSNKGNTPIEEYKDGILIKIWPNLISLHEETKIPKSSIVNWINKRRNNTKGITYKYQK